MKSNPLNLIKYIFSTMLTFHFGGNDDEAKKMRRLQEEQFAYAKTLDKEAKLDKKKSERLDPRAAAAQSQPQRLKRMFRQSLRRDVRQRAIPKDTK